MSINWSLHLNEIGAKEDGLFEQFHICITISITDFLLIQSQFLHVYRTSNEFHMYDLCWFTVIFPSATHHKYRFYPIFNICLAMNSLSVFVKSPAKLKCQPVCVRFLSNIHIFVRVLTHTHTHTHSQTHVQNVKCKMHVSVIIIIVARFDASLLQCFDFKYHIVTNDGYFDKAINIIHISCCEMFVQPQEIINKYIEVQCFWGTVHRERERKKSRQIQLH